MNLYYCYGGNDPDNGIPIVGASLGKAKHLYWKTIRTDLEYTEISGQLIARNVERPAGPLDLDDPLFAEYFEPGDEECLP